MTDDTILAVEAQMQRRSGCAIKPHQRIGMRFLAQRRQAAILDQAGVGKTWQPIGAMPAGAPVLVVCPNVVKGKWAREWRTLRPEWRASIQRRTAPTARFPAGTPAFRWPRPGEVVIVNYESLPPTHAEVVRLHARAVECGSGAAQDRLVARLRHLQAVRARLTAPHPGTVLVADEVHKCRNRTARVTHRWRDLAAAALADDGRAWLLSGDPLVNRRDELYTVLQAAGLGHALFGTLDGYRAAWDAGDVPEMLKPVMLRRTIEEVLPELPPVSWEVVPVEIDDELRAYCDGIVRALVARGLKVRTLTLEALRAAAQPGTDLGKCVSAMRKRLAALKVPALLEIAADAEELGEPLVVFSAHRGPVDVMASRPGWTVITGDESPAERTRRSEAFQAGKFRGVALTYQAGGEGIDLFRAWRLVAVDMPWTPKDRNQMVGRLRRIGQTSRKILVTRLVAAHPLEERVDEILSEKAEAIETAFPNG